jgi:acetyl esterase/lipase
VGLQAQTSPIDLLTLKPPPADRRIAYGTGPSQFADLRVPPGNGPFPVAIVLHGGCWSAQIEGFPPEATSLDLIAPFAAALTKSGIATWNVEFRRIGNGGGWPQTFHDVAAATALLRTLAPQYHLDLARVIAVGHSSGGHLAEWLASRPKLAKSSELYTRDPLPIAGVADLDGPPSLIDPDGAIARVCGDSVELLLGGTFAHVPERYRDASAAVPMGVRQELFTTGGFGRSWADLSIAFAARATKAGDAVTVHRLDAADHFDIINPQSAFWPEVSKAIALLAGRR